MAIGAPNGRDGWRSILGQMAGRPPIRDGVESSSVLTGENASWNYGAVSVNTIGKL